MNNIPTFLWIMLNAPMLIGCDLTKLDDFTFGLLTNAEVIAINQDVLGKQASRVLEDGKIQIWTKPLSDGSMALGIFNLGDEPLDYKIDLNKLNINGKHHFRDLWKQKDIGEFEKSASVKVNRHGVQLLKVSK